MIYVNAHIKLSQINATVPQWSAAGWGTVALSKVNHLLELLCVILYKIVPLTV